MKEVLGILCAAVSVLAAIVAVDAMNKCADAEEKKSKKDKETPTEDFDCSNCCDDCCECFDDVDVENLDDVEICSDINDDEEIVFDGDKNIKVEEVSNDDDNSKE